MIYESTRLGSSHDLSGFSCGKDSLDGWLRSTAVRACENDLARVFVWTEPGDTTVLAYFSLNPTQVERHEDGGYPQSAHKGFRVIPGYLIGKLALDRALHGRGLGEQLLLDAVGRAVGVADSGGGRLIVVDAIDDAAAAFYQQYGFKSVKGRPSRLFITMATARQALAL
ncbi:GNAT family N-acetyltransferase [Lolliginicoccus suaedae]|uniref:GNAT family N-acetyltransferase n=1 Tax=Lolliginicoccus suaedae TaxID=2605429 RepID=UPI001F2020EA|nr:GNAT family N-acetyltransferase [Lolliginicoccus suaedae]